MREFGPGGGVVFAGAADCPDGDRFVCVFSELGSDFHVRLEYLVVSHRDEVRRDVEVVEIVGEIIAEDSEGVFAAVDEYVARLDAP